jgi:predicted AAA+ superfamily ATPase
MMKEDGYRRRLVDDELTQLLAGLPAVVLQGAKGVGKTVTATRRVKSVVRLDREPERQAFAARDGEDLATPGGILLDEWQRLPSVWDTVRRSVDEGAPPGAFILAGSAAPPGTTIHSGAGRIVGVRMRPMSLAERGLSKPSVGLGDLLSGDRAPVHGGSSVTLSGYVEELLASGFPGIRTLSPRLRTRQLDGYLDAVVEREFAEMGVVVRRPATLRSWLTAYAAATGTTTSFTSILDAATAGLENRPAESTTLVYRDVLARTYVLDQLEPWLPTNNHLNRLAHAPKHYLADPALAARLLRLDSGMLLQGGGDVPVPKQGTILGNLFEHLVVQSLLVYAQVHGARVGHLRVRDGRHEIDAVVDDGSGVVAFEVKLAQDVDDRAVRHLLWLKDQLGDRVRDLVVVTTGRHAYRRPDGVAVVPAALLGP